MLGNTARSLSGLGFGGIVVGARPQPDADAEVARDDLAVLDQAVSASTPIFASA